MQQNHFTYTDEVDSENLHQGDILEKNEEIVRQLSEIHPHYVKEDYTHYQVLTQSCDLALRDGVPKCRYITIAAIRPLRTALERTLLSIDSDAFRLDDLYCWPINKKPRLTEFLRQLYNNNDKEHFFLHRWPEKGLLENSCSFLYLSIALKAEQHYKMLVNAKRIQLDDNFKSKLGWLVGNLYSRVGTRDFYPGFVQDKQSFNEILEEPITDNVLILPQPVYTELKKECKKKSTSEVDEAEIDSAQEIVRYKEEQKQSAAIDKLIQDISRVTNLADGEEKALRNVLATNTLIRKGLKS